MRAHTSPYVSRGCVRSVRTPEERSIAAAGNGDVVIELQLPFPPSVDHYWRHTRNGHFISDAGRSYRGRVAWECKARGLRPMLGRLSVVIRAYPPDNRRRDLDNLLKVLLVPQIDLAGFEDAQRRYQTLRLGRLWGADHADELARLEAEFGLSLMIKPSLAEQRRRPQ